MADKEKDIPVKEQEDGSALIALEQMEDPFEEKGEDKEKEKVTAEDDSDEDTENHAEGGEVEASEADNEEDDGDDEDEREKIREARREERKLKKQLAKEREASARHKISALERRNEELARRLAAVESSTASYKFAQVDKAIEDESTRVEYAKMKLMQAAQEQDAVAQVEYLEVLQEAKNKLAQMQAYKKQQLDEVKKPKQNVPNPVTEEVQRNAQTWLSKNKWYDPQARDTDSRIAKVIDNELAQDGWDPADPEYWDELDNRLAARLPHRYAVRNGTTAKRSGPTASSRTTATNSKPGNTITLSRERVQAIKEAGAWDDVARRNKMIRAYAQFDKENRKG